MECPICGSKSSTTLKSKKVSSNKKEINELLLKCNECDFIYNDSLIEEKPNKYRLIISEHENSKKTFIDLFPDEKLFIGSILLSEFGQSEITSIETIHGKRVEKSIANDISTIWSSSLETPARVGISVDFSGNVDSYKVEVDRDFEFSVKDIIKIGESVFKINVIKTEERKTRTGYSKASITRRIYCTPVRFDSYDYDLTDKVVSKKKIPDYLRKKFR